MTAGGALSPERWSEVYHVLSGKDPDGISVRHACDKIGITPTAVYQWVARSRKLLPDDEPWIHEIHKQFDECRKTQGYVLEDKIWRIAMQGDKMPIIHKGEITGTYQKENTRVIMRMLETRDPNYKKERDGRVSITLEADEIFNRLLAAERFRVADEQKKVIIEQRDVADDAELLEAYREFEECSPSEK